MAIKATKFNTIILNKTAGKPHYGDKLTANITGLAIVAVQYSADTFVINQSLVLRINICAENPALRVAANRV
jgi:hypothetical protein